MASYFPSSRDETTGQLKVEDVQEAYLEQKDRLVKGIDGTKTILADLREFNRDEWVVRYPRLRESESKHPNPLSRAMSFADDPTRETDVVLTRKNGIALADDNDNNRGGDDNGNEPADDFQILRLDLTLGSHGSSTSPTSLVTQLEKSSIATLLDARLCSALSHISKLRQRVSDTSSKVLVTGDLNAGKSTFVNALLRREVMPIDQQPCTTAFCEVHDAAENAGVEEVHVLKDHHKYDIHDEATFSRGNIDELERIIADEHNSQHVLKLYLADTRAPSESLLNNGVVDISLIDAPGLNRDSLKTTALFARQEEIDVVVFVVSAENHFTLSAREFLVNASNEKAYLFIVVNKFDQIKNKDKCKRLVLEQIREFSPRTFEDAGDLVHFVDSAAALQPFTANPAFDDLESALRSFVLVKRAKSKLHPVSTYLHNLLADVELLSSANALVARAELEQAKAELEQVRPVLEQMLGARETLFDALDAVEDTRAVAASERAQRILESALERVARGQLDKMPSYPGLLGVWAYARDVRRALVASLDQAVKMSEDEARGVTVDGVGQVAELAERYLPTGVERSRRVFMPEAMFTSSSTGKKTRGVAGLGLGLGLVHRSDLMETTFLDIFDIPPSLFSLFPTDAHTHEERTGTLGLVSVGAGVFTMVGGQLVGARGALEGVLRLGELLSSDSARKWLAPLLGASVLGLGVYIVLELPRSVPRTVGRRVARSVDKGWVEVHKGRVGRETRKVLKLASWDLRERFRAAMDERGKEVRCGEEMERKALRAREWFEEVLKRTEEVRLDARLGVVG